LRNFAAGKVRVGKQVWGEIALFVTYPSDLPMVLRRRDITHKPVELAVAFGRPFGDEAG
jgi:hypothetical protein